MSGSVEPVTLVPGVGAWFTGRAAGNLSHHRPHLPSRLARSRSVVAAAMGLSTEDLHWMRQVHGAGVGVVDATTPPGAELPDVDALVTSEPGRALAVQVADCVPVLLASTAGPVAAVHAGRRGLVAGVVEATLAGLSSLGAPPDTLRAVVGPAIGGCCYEVPAVMRDAVGARYPRAAATTTWGTPALDLPGAVTTLLRDRGVEVVAPAQPGAHPGFGCTRCDPAGRWFSHRVDPASGRQLGVVVRWSPAHEEATSPSGDAVDPLGPAPAAGSRVAS